MSDQSFLSVDGEDFCPGGNSQSGYIIWKPENGNRKMMYYMVRYLLSGRGGRGSEEERESEIYLWPTKDMKSNDDYNWKKEDDSSIGRLEGRSINLFPFPVIPECSSVAKEYSVKYTLLPIVFGERRKTNIPP